MNSYLNNSYMPSEVDVPFAIKFVVIAAVAGVVLLGAKYLFKKREAALFFVFGFGFLGLLTMARTQARVPVHVAEPSLIGLARTDALEPASLTGIKPQPSKQPSSPEDQRRLAQRIKSHLTQKVIQRNQLPSSAIQQIVGSNAPISITVLPSWVKNPPHEGTLGAGYCKYVLTSQLYATSEEAETELNRLLAVDVQQSFTVGESPAVGWSPTADDLRNSGLVTEKVIETVPMKVGEFDTSVQKISWLVEFKPASQLALFTRWQSSEAQRRSKLILSALAAISGVMGVSAFALRRKQTQPLPATGQLA